LREYAVAMIDRIAEQLLVRRARITDVTSDTLGGYK
jgi:hypothetical protein